MSAPPMAVGQSNSSVSGPSTIQVRDFINKTDRYINIRGYPEALNSITTIIDQGYNQQLTSTDRFWCALEALQISTEPICASIARGPFLALDGFLRMRMGLEYAQWAVHLQQTAAAAAFPPDFIRDDIMGYNNFSAEVMAKLVSLAGTELGLDLQLGVCAQSPADGIWDVSLYHTEEGKEKHVVWVTNDNIADENIEKHLGETVYNHWSGIGFDQPVPRGEEAIGESTDVKTDQQREDIGPEHRDSPTEPTPSKEPRRKGKKRSDAPTDETKPAKKAKTDGAEVKGSRTYRNNNDAPPASTDLPHADMDGITPEELWIYFPNHCQNWPVPALQLINGNATDRTTTSWSWLEESINNSRLLDLEARGWALANTINKAITRMVTTELGVENWVKQKHIKQKHIKQKHKPLSNADVASRARVPPAGSPALMPAWPLWRIGANLVRHEHPGVFRDRVIADMLAHAEEVVGEWLRLAADRDYHVSELALSLQEHTPALAALVPVAPTPSGPPPPGPPPPGPPPPGPPPPGPPPSRPPPARPRPTAPPGTAPPTQYQTPWVSPASNPRTVGQTYYSPYLQDQTQYPPVETPYPTLYPQHTEPNQPPIQPPSPSPPMTNSDADGSQTFAPQPPANAIDETLIDPALLNGTYDGAETLPASLRQGQISNEPTAQTTNQLADQQP